MRLARHAVLAHALQIPCRAARFLFQRRKPGHGLFQLRLDLGEALALVVSMPPVARPSAPIRGSRFAAPCALPSVRRSCAFSILDMRVAFGDFGLMRLDRAAASSSSSATFLQLRGAILAISRRRSSVRRYAYPVRCASIPAGPTVPTIRSSVHARARSAIRFRPAGGFPSASRAASLFSSLAQLVASAPR
jgi:hypothetical protein